MIFCRIQYEDDTLVFGEGINPESALQDARDEGAGENMEATASVTFWKAEKMSLRVEWEPRILGPED